MKKNFISAKIGRRTLVVKDILIGFGPNNTNPIRGVVEFSKLKIADFYYQDGDLTFFELYPSVCSLLTKKLGTPLSSIVLSMARKNIEDRVNKVRIEDL